MTKIKKIQAPDGTIIKVEGPDDATDEQFIQEGMRLYGEQAPKTLTPPGIPAPQLMQEMRGQGPQPSLGDNPLAAMTVGVGPSSFGERFTGAASALSNMLPGTNPFQTPQPLTPQQDIGAKVATVSSVAAAGEPLVNALKNRVSRMVPAAASPVDEITQKLAPSGKTSALYAHDVAPTLAQDPALVAAKPGKAFDDALIAKLKGAGKATQAIESAIPDATTVVKTPLMKGFNDLIAEAERNGADDAVRALMKQKSLIEEANGADNPTMSWDQFYGNKQRFGNDVKGAFKRITDGMATEKDEYLVRAYGNFMEATKSISPELGQANSNFHMLKKALAASGIDEDAGRLSLVGKGPIADIARGGDTQKMKLAKTLAKVGGGTLIGATGYKAMRDIWGQ